MNSLITVIPLGVDSTTPRPQRQGVILDHSLDLYVRHPLGMFDSVLAATAMASGVTALVSADKAFGRVPGLRHIDPTAPASLADLGLDG